MLLCTRIRVLRVKMDERERFRQNSAGRLVGIASWYPMTHRCGQSAGDVRKARKA